ncbi:AAA family ATPase [Sporolactobacillus laevolacticus]|uniref:ATPase AAA n=1 Tax=Sporolactobacillus laevolacticus DSM 442 TaxID=1395513 RepID=V6IXN4_9BACL|nr:AAA family ATPase [Sporolactobacillus laevolacticus]EST11436.1 ATPase AAA [Sporolactobacillus laevolacticus DSM 442]
MAKNLFIRGFRIDHAAPAYSESYLSKIPVLRHLDTFEFRKKVTFFVGENGTGKSTILEALAVSSGYNPEGGSKNFNFATSDTHSNLYRAMRVVKGIDRPRDVFFLRAESFYNLASNIDEIGDPLFLEQYGGRSLHEQSHGESFLSLMLHRFRGNGLYILDEPEAALSPSKLMTMLARMHELVNQHSQFIIATHSPMLMAYPNADIYVLAEGALKKTLYEDTEHYIVTRHFLEDPKKMLHYLLD